MISHRFSRIFFQDIFNRSLSSILSSGLSIESDICVLFIRLIWWWNIFDLSSMISDFDKSLLFIGVCLFNESDRLARIIFFCSVNALFWKNAVISLNVVGIKNSLLLISVANDKD